MTRLDEAHAAMGAGGDAERLRFWERLADAALFLLLEREAAGDRIAPRVFALEDGPVVLAFDTEERLADFAGAAPYAELSGRALARLLSAEGLGLGLNLEVAPSAILLSAPALAWLSGVLAERPRVAEARPIEVAAPDGLPDALLAALDAKLPGMAGLVQGAFLARVRYADGRQGHLLAFRGAVSGAEEALAAAAGEALIFSGLDAGVLDVAFLAAGDQLEERLARVALRLDPPAPPAAAGPAAPGLDPERPPRLR